MVYISRGNMKVKANIFSLPSKTTRKQGLDCHSYCYAAKAEIQYPATKAVRLRNLAASRSPTFTVEVIDMLKTRRNKVVRVHESGDFYSIKYIRRWYLIAKMLPSYTFYAYTKRDDLFIQIPDDWKPLNFTLIYSLDGIDVKGGLPSGFDKLARVSSKNTTCPAQKDKKILCVKHCSICYDSDINEIVFLKH
jgi:hypothetical protein